MILYINKTDKLPDDEYMIRLLKYCIDFLNDTNNYKIEINLDDRNIEIWNNSKIDDFRVKNRASNGFIFKVI